MRGLENTYQTLHYIRFVNKSKSTQFPLLHVPKLHTNVKVFLLYTIFDKFEKNIKL